MATCVFSVTSERGPYPTCMGSIEYVCSWDLLLRRLNSSVKLLNNYTTAVLSRIRSQCFRMAWTSERPSPHGSVSLCDNKNSAAPCRAASVSVSWLAKSAASIYSAPPEADTRLNQRMRWRVLIWRNPRRYPQAQPKRVSSE